VVYDFALERDQFINTPLLNKFAIIVKVSIDTAALVNDFAVYLMRLGQRRANFCNLES